jgi:hypothetical protein
MLKGGWLFVFIVLFVQPVLAESVSSGLEARFKTLVDDVRVQARSVEKPAHRFYSRRASYTVERPSRPATFDKERELFRSRGSNPDRSFTVREPAREVRLFAGEEGTDERMFDLHILSTCFGGTPFTVVPYETDKTTPFLSGFTTAWTIPGFPLPPILAAVGPRRRRASMCLQGSRLQSRQEQAGPLGAAVRAGETAGVSF